MIEPTRRGPRMKLFCADGAGWPEAVPLDPPGRVVGLAEIEQRPAQVLDGVEGPHPQEVFLERADEAFGAALAFGGADERGRAFDAEEDEFLLQGVGHVLAAMVMPHGEPLGDVLAECAEAMAHALSDRPTPPRRRRWGRAAAPIQRGAGEPPEAADPSRAIRLAAAGRGRLAHHLCVRRAQGPGRASSRTILARVERLAAPAARKASRQPLSVAAVTPSERDPVSRRSHPLARIIHAG